MASAPTGGLAFGDRWNAVLVRELRQSMRGNQFRITFALAVTAGLVGAFGCLLMAGSQPREMGQALAVVIAVASSLACGVLVPIGAFQSLAREWEEGTMELLELSSLTPARLLLGKLLCAGVQTVLYMSGLTPFLAVAFVMSGIGLLEALRGVIGLLLLSLCLSCAAFSMASRARSRMARVLLLGVFVLLMMWVGPIVVIGLFAGRGAGVFVSGSALPTGLVLIGVLYGAASGFAAACMRLRHAEENRSTPGRVVTTSGFALALGLLLWQCASGLGAASSATIWALALVQALFGASLMYAAEIDGLGMRVRLEVPASALRARCWSPFLPGGARGILWFACALATLCAALGLAFGFAAWRAGKLGEFLADNGALLLGRASAQPEPAPAAAAFGWLIGTPSPVACGALIVAALYAFAFLAVPAGLAALLPLPPLWRSRLTVALPLAFVVVSVVGTTLGAVLLAPGRAEPLGALSNPYFVIPALLEREPAALSAVGWAWGGALLGLALNLPRLLRADRELQTASAARRAREQRLSEAAELAAASA